MIAPLGLPAGIWLVIWPDGQRNYLEKEPNEGITEWSKGVNATIAYYPFGSVVLALKPPPKKKP